MSTELAFTHQETLIAAGLFIGFILLIIYAGRNYMSRQSKSNLSEKYRDQVFSSPLVGRNKYPDVDVFTYSNQFFLIGLALTLFLVIGAMGMTSYEEKVHIPDNALEMEEDIEIEPPRSAEPPPPPPPPPPPLIAEVPNETIIAEDDDLEFVDQSVEEHSAVEVVPQAPKPVKKEVPPPPPPPPPPPEPKIAEIFQVVEEMPRFPGCENITEKKEKYDCATQKMLEFIYSNIQYPDIARENNVQGTVVVRFVVNETGKISDVELIRDIGAKCGEEALRIVNLMNTNGITWHPGKQRSKLVKVRMNLPIKFKLIT